MAGTGSGYEEYGSVTLVKQKIRGLFFIFLCEFFTFPSGQALRGSRIGLKDNILGLLLNLDPVGGCTAHDEDVLRGDVQLEGIRTAE